MKKALQVFGALCAAATITVAAAAAGTKAENFAEGLMQKEPIAGTVQWPEGAGTPQAIFQYQYPQFEAQTEADKAINRYYQAQARDLESAVQSMMDGEETLESTIDFEVSHASNRYLSVVQTMRQMGGNAETETLSADTFARDGVYAGQPVTLSQMLGMEQENTLSVHESAAETLVYGLVWQIVERGMQNADGDYLDGITPEDLKRSFSPETDFYLDADGNLVFFIQKGEIAGEIAGILTFPFAPAEILSTIRK